MSCFWGRTPQAWKSHLSVLVSEGKFGRLLSWACKEKSFWGEHLPSLWCDYCSHLPAKSCFCKPYVLTVHPLSHNHRPHLVLGFNHNSVISWAKLLTLIPAPENAFFSLPLSCSLHFLSIFHFFPSHASWEPISTNLMGAFIVFWFFFFKSFQASFSSC